VRAGGDHEETTPTSEWQLANWTGLLPDREIDTASCNRDWIWNEGVPADIARFEGTRTVLIGKSTMTRSWNGERVFAGMEAMLDLEATRVNGCVPQTCST
jgi:hypothetical protein